MTAELASIRRPFGPADLEPLLRATGVDRTVLVQTRASLDETREFLATAAATSFVAGVVGWVDVTDPGIGEVIAELRAGPGGDRLVAVRHQVHDETDPHWLARAEVRRGLRAVAAAGLTYDLLVRTREMPAALGVARDLPDLPFVIDHLAKPAIASGSWQPWADRLSAFGELSNVTCKVSGLVTEASWTAWTAAGIRPYVDHALSVYGPGRLLFGSDWPVCLVAARYDQVLALARATLDSLTESEQTAVFGGNAMRVYRLAAP